LQRVILPIGNEVVNPDLRRAACTKPAPVPSNVIDARRAHSRYSHLDIRVRIAIIRRVSVKRTFAALLDDARFRVLRKLGGSSGDHLDGQDA
jgi:hypothetical protein